MDTSLKKRLTALSDKAEKIWQRDDMQARIGTLATYYNSGRGRTTDDSSIVHVNKVMPRTRTSMSSLFAKRPEVLTKGRRVHDEAAAKNSELMLNYLVRFMKYPAEIRDCLFWSRLAQYGVVKLGMEKKGGMVLPMMRACDPRSYRCDPMLETFRPEEGSWEKFKFRRSLASMIQSGLYEEPEIGVLRDKINTGGGADLPDEVVEVWLQEHYYRDAGGFKVSTAASGFNDHGFPDDDMVWARDQEFTKVIGLPGRVLTFFTNPAESDKQQESFYPNSPVEFWLEQQKEIDGFRTQKLLHAERANAKMLYDPTKFAGPEETSGLESREPRQFIPASNAGGQIDKVMSAIKFDPVNPDVWAGEQEADNTIQEIDGQGSVALGNTQAERGSVSATRDQLVENAMRLRASDSQEIFEDWMESTFQGLLNLAQKHMKGPLWVRITGEKEVYIDTKEIEGNIDVIMAFASTLPKDEQSEWEKAKEFYELIAANPLANQERNLTELIKARKIRGGAEGWIVPQMPMAPPPAAGGAPGLGTTSPAGDPFGADLLQMLAQQSVGEGQSALGSAASLRNQT